PCLPSSSRTELPMDLDTLLDEAAPARHVRLDGPDSPAAVSLYRRIITQPPAAATARRRYRHLVAVPAIAGTCAVVAVAIIYGSQLRSNDAPAPQQATAAAVLGQAALPAARQPTAAVPGPGPH